MTSGATVSRELAVRISNPWMLHKRRGNRLKSSLTDVGLMQKCVKHGAHYKRKKPKVRLT